MKQNGVVTSQDPRSYSLYFDLNISFRAQKVTGTLEKRAPGLKTGVENDNNNNNNNELYLHDHTSTYSIAKAMFRN